MSNFIKNKKGEIIEVPPYKCRVCGIGDIENNFDICPYCGWEDDDIQNDKPDFMGGANNMSLNQYKKFWEENQEEILKSQNTCHTAIDLSKKYYKEHFSK
ncbi:MAG: CPCC family cysteine-rich protein [Clostridia bacterium]